MDAPAALPASVETSPPAHAKSPNWIAVVVGFVAVAAAAGGVWYFAWPAYLPFSDLNKMSPLERDDLRQEEARLRRELNLRLPGGWNCSSLTYLPKHGSAELKIDPAGATGCAVTLSLSHGEGYGQRWLVEFLTPEAAASRQANVVPVTAGNAWFYLSRRGGTVLARHCQVDDPVEWRDRMEVVALDLVARAREVGIR